MIGLQKNGDARRAALTAQRQTRTDSADHTTRGPISNLRHLIALIGWLYQPLTG